jgi:hypothetical protein
VNFTKQEKSLLRRVMRELGRRGGKASANSLTPEQRRARATKAAHAAAKSLTPTERSSKAAKAGRARQAKRKEASHA